MPGAAGIVNAPPAPHLPISKSPPLRALHEDSFHRFKSGPSALRMKVRSPARMGHSVRISSFILPL